MYRVAFTESLSFRSFAHSLFALATFILVLAPLGFVPEAKASNKYAAYVIDVKSGKVLFSRNAKSLRYPASLTKMMTLYMLFEELEKGNLSLKSRLKVSKYAAGRPPSKLGLRPGSTISVRNAIYALVTKSANDVAATVAENLGGSESKFAAMMTRTARSIGMSRTTFKNASGLPNKYQKTTAADMALLGRALQDRFPKYYGYFKTRSFKYGRHRYGNHNRLLGRVKGVDGIKTGYTRASGFNLVTNVKNRDRHIVAVVMGGKTGRSRDAHMAKLIKTYLPKAKRGKRRTALVVPRAGTNRDYIKLASKIRLPKAKRSTMRLASAQPVQKTAATPSTLPTPAPIQLAKADSFGSLPRAKSKAAPIDLTSTAAISTTPRPRLTTAALATPPLPRAANDPIGDLSSHESRASSQAIPMPAPVQATPEGWHIQLGATPSLQAAEKILAKARAKNKRMLVAVANYTETVEKNNTTLYRARFAGFSSKSAARKACSTLKKQKFACLALHP